jgi:hypothetical protein
MLKKIVATSMFIASVAAAGTVESELSAIAAQTQKHLPATLADGVTAITMAALGKNMMMQYRLDVDAKTFKRDKTILENLSKSSINSQCSNPQMRNLLNRGAVLTYMYLDTGGVHLGESTVTQEICRRNKL